jgi:hypothetical protein
LVVLEACPHVSRGATVLSLLRQLKAESFFPRDLSLIY